MASKSWSSSSLLSEHDDAGVRQLALQALGRLDPVRGRQAQVHEDHVGRELLDRGERFAPAACLADDFDVGLQLEDVAHATPEQRVAVDDDDAGLSGATVAALATLVSLDLGVHHFGSSSLPVRALLRQTQQDPRAFALA